MYSVQDIRSFVRAGSGLRSGHRVVSRTVILLGLTSMFTDPGLAWRPMAPGPSAVAPGIAGAIDGSGTVTLTRQSRKTSGSSA